MKILLCTSEIGNNAGGLALHCDQLKEIYQELGHEVYVENVFDLDSIPVISGGYDALLAKKMKISFKLKGLVDSFSNIDICVSCGAGYTAYYSMLFCKESGNVPLYVVLCGSDINISFADGNMAFFNSEALSYASHIISVSKELIDNALLFCADRNKYTIIPNYCYINDNFCDGKKTKGKIVFATGSTYLNEKKGIASLLYAFSALNSRVSDVILYLFGKVDEDLRQQYEEIIKANDIEDNVIFCGYMDREEYIKKIQEVDVYIQASPFEGFSNSVAEAICVGKDILVTETGYIYEMIRDEFPSHIVSSLNPEKMADEISSYINHTYSNGDISKIRCLLREHCDREKIIDDWAKVLHCNEKAIFVDVKPIGVAVMFHDITDIYTGVDYAEEGFSKLVQLVANNGMKLCSAHEYFESSDKSRLIVCTFDDGYENVYLKALPIMQSYGFTATVYICPDLIAQDNSWNHKDDCNRRHLDHNMICELVKNKWEIGSHGLSHINMLRLSEHEIDKSLLESKRMLSVYGDIDSYCYPYGSYNVFIKNKVSKYYKNAFSVSIGGTDYTNDMYQITRLTPEELVERLR